MNRMINKISSIRFKVLQKVIVTFVVIFLGVTALPANPIKAETLTLTDYEKLVTAAEEISCDDLLGYYYGYLDGEDKATVDMLKKYLGEMTVTSTMLKTITGNVINAIKHYMTSNGDTDAGTYLPSTDTIDYFKILFAYKGMRMISEKVFYDDRMDDDVYKFDHLYKMSRTDFHTMCDEPVSGYEYGAILGAYSTMITNLSNIHVDGYTLDFVNGEVISDEKYKDEDLVKVLSGLKTEDEAAEYALMKLSRTEITNSSVLNAIKNSCIGDIRYTNSYYLDDVIVAYLLIRSMTVIKNVGIYGKNISAKQLFALTRVANQTNIDNLTFNELETMTGVYFDWARKKYSTVKDFFETEVGEIAVAYQYMVTLANSPDGTEGKEEAIDEVNAFEDNIAALMTIEDVVTDVVLGDYSMDFTTRSYSYSIEALAKETVNYTMHSISEIIDNEIKDEKTKEMVNLLYYKMIVKEEKMATLINGLLGVAKENASVAHEYLIYLNFRENVLKNVLDDTSLNPYKINVDQLYLFWKLNGTIDTPASVDNIYKILTSYGITYDNLDFPDGTTVNDILFTLNAICNKTIYYSGEISIQNALEVYDYFTRSLMNVEYRGYSIDIINHCLAVNEMEHDGIVYGLTKDSQGNDAAEVIDIYSEIPENCGDTYFGKGNPFTNKLFQQLPISFDDINDYFIKHEENVYEYNPRYHFEEFIETDVTDKEKAIALLDNYHYTFKVLSKYGEFTYYYLNNCFGDVKLKGNYSYYDLINTYSLLSILFIYRYAEQEVNNIADFDMVVQKLMDSTHMNKSQLFGVLALMVGSEYSTGQGCYYDVPLEKLSGIVLGGYGDDYSELSVYYESSYYLYKAVIEEFNGFGYSFYTTKGEYESSSDYEARYIKNSKFLRGVLNTLILSDIGMKYGLEHAINGNYEYNLLTGEITVHEACNPELVIPDYVPGTNLKVVGIGKYACLSQYYLDSVTFPEYLEYIDTGAFEDASIKYGYSFSGGGKYCTTIGDHAFDEAYFGGTAAIPDGIKTIGEDAFEMAGVKEILWSENMSNVVICDWAFYDNDIIDLVIPEGITEIGYCAFASAYMKTMSLPASLEKINGPIGGSAEINNSLEKITVAEGNKILKAVDGALYSADGKTLIEYPGGLKDELVKIPEGVEVIGPIAFDNCKNITELVLPKSIKSINDSAIYYCVNLKELTLPNCETKSGIFYNGGDSSLSKINIIYKTELTEGILTVELSNTSVYLGKEFGNKSDDICIYSSGTDMKLSAKDSNGNDVSLSTTEIKDSWKYYSFTYLLSLLKFNPSFEISIPSEFDSSSQKMKISLVSEYAEGKKFYVDVDSSNTFKLDNGNGVELPFSLTFKNGEDEKKVSAVESGHVWEFAGTKQVAKSGEEEWVEVYVDVDKDDIQYAGTYTGTVTFSYGLSE